MKKPFTLGEWTKCVDDYGLVIFKDSQRTEIGSIESGRLEEWPLAEQAEFIYWAGSHFKKADFLEFMYRRMLPGNVIQIG